MAFNNKSRRTLWIVNTVGAIVLTFLFILTVMTAITQQEVVTRMKAEQLNLGYGEARGVRDEALKRQDELDKRMTTEVTLEREYRTAETNWKQTGRQFDDAWADFLPYLQRIARNKICEIALPSDNDIAPRIVALNDYRECLGANGGSRPVTDGKETAEKFAATLVAHRKTNLVFGNAKDRLEDARADADEGKLTDTQSKVVQIFKDMDVLLSGWFLLGGGLVALPPAMLQILLTFFSGLFGAVLITFVLLVYPKDVVDVTKTKETWARIFLGGLVGLSIYIVLLGGAAILGTNSGIIAAGTNYMAFCGIGVLGGMFSDRAAAWLSERANAFFKGNAGNPKHTTSVAGTPPPPPPPPPPTAATPRGE